MAMKRLTPRQIRAALAEEFRSQRRQGYAPPINAGGRRPWSWAPILAALSGATP